MKKIYACLIKILSLSLLPLAVQASSNNFTYYVNDAVGSPVVAMNQAGDVIWRKTYQPYGKASGKDGDNRIGYTGHIEDKPDLVYAGARYYDPDLVRYLSDDPVRFTESNPMSFNRYAYANNNPFKYVDPDGRDAVGITFQGYMVNTGINDIKLPLGHAGVLLINNATGGTKYYEFGRYDGNASGIVGEKLPKADGNIRNVKVSDAVIGADGKATQASLDKIYGELSAQTGQGKSVDATYYEGADFNLMQSYVNNVANDKGREKYSLSGNTCYNFKGNVINAGNNKEDK